MAASEFVGPLVDLFVLLLAAKIVGWVFQKVKQPGVIGEVVGGILVGPAIVLSLDSALLGPYLGAILEGPLVHENELLEFIAELGAIFLLFLVGIETRLEDILGVGKEALFVGTLGVIVPFGAGWAVSLYVGYSQVTSLFVGTALVATSVGITARVLQELQVLSKPYSRIILGAAVIDDVLGLIVLAIVSGIASTGSFVVGEVAQLVLLSALFVAGAAALVPAMARLKMEWLPFDKPLEFAIVFGVGMAALSAVIGLAPIVGAFFAGMLLAEFETQDEAYELEEPIQGTAALLTPVFFAVIGLKLELGVLIEPEVLLLGSVLTVIAIAGKLVGGLGALSQGKREAAIVGMGMVPRGEVGLIVAAIGLSAGAVQGTQYAVVLFVVVVTTVLAPIAMRPMIRWAEEAGEVDEPPAGATPDLPDVNS
jgi:Kef-type K+ transport system membrane component KefB